MAIQTKHRKYFESSWRVANILLELDRSVMSFKDMCDVQKYIKDEFRRRQQAEHQAHPDLGLIGCVAFSVNERTPRN